MVTTIRTSSENKFNKIEKYLRSACRRLQRKNNKKIDIPTAVIRCLKHDEVYELPKRTGLDCAELFELLDQWFEDLDDDAISLSELQEELQKLFDDNKQVGFVNKLREYNLSEDEEALIAFFCHRLVNRDDDDIRFGQIEDLFDTKADFNKAKARLRSGEHKLMTKKIIEHRCEDGIATASPVCSTAGLARERQRPSISWPDRPGAASWWWMCRASRASGWGRARRTSRRSSTATANR